MVLLDTCGVIELGRDKPCLKKETLKSLEEGTIVLSIAFAEIAVKLKKGHLVMNLSAEELYAQYLQISNVSIVDIGVTEWLDAVALDWKNKDPVDRLLVAYAKKRNLPIVTSDRLIKLFFKNVLW